MYKGELEEHDYMNIYIRWIVHGWIYHITVKIAIALMNKVIITAVIFAKVT